MPQVRRLLKEMVAVTHALDPTRPAAASGVQRGDLDRLGDIAGYNGDGAVLFPNPGVPNFVAEYGSPMVDRPGGYEPAGATSRRRPAPSPGASAAGVSRGARARWSGPASTTAPLPVTSSAPWASSTTPGCPSVPGTGIAMPTAASRRRPGRSKDARRRCG